MERLLISLFCILLFDNCQSDPEQKLRIATASSMRYALEELSVVYSEIKGIDCELIFSSSGKLASQIKEGAPYDVYLAANMDYPQYIYKQGLSTKPKVYAIGSLVLWTMENDLRPSLDKLKSEAVQKIAIPNPRFAPYGRAVLQTLEQSRLIDTIRHKLIYGETISSCNAIITSKSVNIGFTSKSSVVAPAMEKEGKWSELSSDLYSPIKHGGIVILNKRGLEKEAQAFLDFMESEKASAILKKYGYNTERLKND